MIFTSANFILYFEVQTATFCVAAVVQALLRVYEVLPCPTSFWWCLALRHSDAECVVARGVSCQSWHHQCNHSAILKYHLLCGLLVHRKIAQFTQGSFMALLCGETWLSETRRHIRSFSVLQVLGCSSVCIVRAYIMCSMLNRGWKPNLQAWQAALSLHSRRSIINTDASFQSVAVTCSSNWLPC